MKTKSILIVEDNKTIAYNLRSLLNKLGFHITSRCVSAEETIETLDKLNKIGKVPDVVLMDIELKGGMNGIEAAKLIIPKYDTVVIFTTGTERLETINKVINCKPYAYITKPYKLHQIKANLEIALKRRELDKELKTKHKDLENELKIKTLELEKEKNENKQKEEQTKEQNTILDIMLNAFVYPFYVIDANNNQVIKTNVKAGANFNDKNIKCYALSQLSNISCAKTICLLEEVKQTKKAVIVKHTIKDANGKNKNIEIYLYPIFNNIGDINYVVEYSIDIIDQ